MNTEYTWVKIVERPDPGRAARAVLSRVANVSAVTARAVAAGALRRLSHRPPSAAASAPISSADPAASGRRTAPPAAAGTSPRASGTAPRAASGPASSPVSGSTCSPASGASRAAVVPVAPEAGTAHAAAAGATAPPQTAEVTEATASSAARASAARASAVRASAVRASAARASAVRASAVRASAAPQGARAVPVASGASVAGVAAVAARTASESAPPPVVAAAAAEPVAEAPPGTAAVRGAQLRRQAHGEAPAVRGAQEGGPTPPSAPLAPPVTGSAPPLALPHASAPAPAGARALRRRHITGATDAAAPDRRALNIAARPADGLPVVPRPGSPAAAARQEAAASRPVLVWSPLRLPGTVSVIVPVPAAALASPPSTVRAVPIARTAVGGAASAAPGRAGDAFAADPGAGAGAGAVPPARGRHAAPGRPRTLGLARPAAAGWRAVRGILTRRGRGSGEAADTAGHAPGSAALVPAMPAPVAAHGAEALAAHSAADGETAHTPPVVPHPLSGETGQHTAGAPPQETVPAVPASDRGSVPAVIASRDGATGRRDGSDRVTDASARAVRADARRRLGRLAPRGRSWRPPAWGLVVAGLATGLLAGLGYGMLAPVEYEARGHVVVRASEGTDPAAVVGFAQVYGRIAAEPAVLSQVGSLPGTVRAASSPDAPVVEITGTAGSPSEAAAVANAVAPALVAYGNEAEAMTGTRLAVLTEARPPSSPSSPPPAAAAGVGAAGGTLLAALALLVRHHRREHRPARGAAPSPAGDVTVLSRPTETAALPAPAPAPMGELTR